MEVGEARVAGGSDIIILVVRIDRGGSERSVRGRDAWERRGDKDAVVVVGVVSFVATRISRGEQIVLRVPSLVAVEHLCGGHATLNLRNAPKPIIAVCVAVAVRIPGVG